MKIERIEVYPIRVNLRQVFMAAHGPMRVQESVIVRVTTDDGYRGLGDVDPSPGYSEETLAEIVTNVRDLLGPALIDRDALNAVEASHVMDELLPRAYAAKAAVEMALWDIRGKRFGEPVCTVLGGRVRTDIGLNAWIGLLAPEAAAREAEAWLARGFRSAKVKIGSGFEADRERVAAVRSAVSSHMELRVDGNEAFSVDDAIRIGRALEPYDLRLLEQPVARRDLDGLARVRRAVGIPIMADEAVEDAGTLIEIIRREAADLVKVKVMKQGGLLATCHLIAIAEAAGVACVIGHGFGLTVSTLAELHVAASCRNVIDGVECVGPLKMQDDVVKAPLVLEGGRVGVPAAPGLGAELDEESLARHAVAV